MRGDSPQHACLRLTKYNTVFYTSNLSGKNNNHKRQKDEW